MFARRFGQRGEESQHPMGVERGARDLTLSSPSPKERAENGPDLKIEDKVENRHGIKGGGHDLVAVDKYINIKIPYERRR